MEIVSGYERSVSPEFLVTLAVVQHLYLVRLVLTAPPRLARVVASRRFYRRERFIARACSSSAGRVG